MPRAAAEQAECRELWIAGANQICTPERKGLMGSIATPSNPCASGGNMPAEANRCRTRVRTSGTRNAAISALEYCSKTAKKPLKDVLVWDKKLPGFGTRTYPSGARVYVVQYRERKRTRRREIGSADVMDLRTARRKARKILEDVKLGFGVVDPFAVKADPTSMRFADFIPVFLGHQKRLWSPRTFAKSSELIERVLRPEFSIRIMLDIDRSDVMRWRDGLASRPGNANRTIPILSAMMKLAEQLGLRPANSNPCRGLPRYKRPAKVRFLELDEITRVGTWLDRHQDQWPQSCAMITLLLLTGARKAEIETLEWDWLDGEVAHLPRSKTGPKLLYLGKAAQELLAQMPRQTDVPFVFPTIDGTRAAQVQQHVWYQLREEVGISDVRLHDLRHTFASHAVMRGYTLPVVSRLLGHALLETSERYAHLNMTSVRDAASRVSGHLARLTGFGVSGAMR
jgi:integrase